MWWGTMVISLLGIYSDGWLAIVEKVPPAAYSKGGADMPLDPN
jgi:hypothetical protein